MTKEDLLDKSFQSFAFDKNVQLRSVGVVQSLGPSTLYLETYLLKMRKIYYECTINEVEWFPKGLSDTEHFNIQFGKIIGIPNTERAKTAHLYPGLLNLGACIAGGSLTRDIRRQVYLFENFGGTILGGCAMATMAFALSYQVIVLNHFYARKYETKPFEKECGMCWAIKSTGIVVGSLAISTGMTQLLINIYDDIFSRKVLSGERMIQGRYWSFWWKVYRQSFIKNGRPKFGLTNAALASTITLAVIQAFRLVDDERDYRQQAIIDYMENYEAKSSINSNRFIY